MSFREVLQFCLKNNKALYAFKKAEGGENYYSVFKKWHSMEPM